LNKLDFSNQFVCLVLAIQYFFCWCRVRWYCDTNVLFDT